MKARKKPSALAALRERLSRLEGQVKAMEMALANVPARLDKLEVVREPSTTTAESKP